jgi:hypothetical protein
MNISTNIFIASTIRITAKMFFKRDTGMECASFAPNGTVMNVPTTTPKSAGK